MFPLDLLADLPDPGDDEPSSLRVDITDELADHLRCAFRREVLKDGDAAAAQRRALDRFGDPKKLARRLWWQAMRSRLMRQRIVSGLQWTVALTAMVISGAVFWQQSQLLAELRQARQEDAAQRQALTAKLDQFQHAGTPAPAALILDQLSDPYGSSAAPTIPQTGLDFNTSPMLRAPDPDPSEHLPQDLDRGPPALTLKLVRETEDGPPVSPKHAVLIGSGGKSYSERPTKDNKLVFQSLEPDLYELSLLLADGQQSQRSLMIRESIPRELTILCPGPRKKAPVPITIKPLPVNLKLDVSLNVWAAPMEIGQGKWTARNVPRQSIAFDAQTGLPTAIDVVNEADQQHLDLQDLPVDERRVFLPVGTVHYQFEASERREGPGAISVYAWPNHGESFKHTVQADETPWELEVPRELLEEVSRDIRTNDPSSAPPGPVPFDSPNTSEQGKILNELQGKWVVIDGLGTAPSGDVAANNSEHADMFFVFQNNMIFSGRGQQQGGPLPFSIEVTKSPMWIDIDAMKGVFRLENDRLTICFGPERPAGLDLAPGVQAERYVARRAAPNDQPAKAATLEPKLPDALAQLQGIWTRVASRDDALQVGGASTENEAIAIAGETATRGDGKVKCKITVNDTKSPMWIDIENSAVMSIHDPADINKVEPMEGIFRIDGDTLTMQLGIQGQRPPEFSLAAEHSILFVFKRKQKP